MKSNDLNTRTIGAAVGQAPESMNAWRCLIASQMREHGFSGGQIHAVAVRDLLRCAGVEVRVVTPFSGSGLLRNVVFGARYVLRRFSKQAAIYWLRAGHNAYLKSALRRELCRDGKKAVLYAQDPLSAKTALSVRRPGIDKVVLVIHFNDSQASEWAMRGEISENGWVYRDIEKLEEEILPNVDQLIFVSEYMRGRLVAKYPALCSVPKIVIPNFVGPPVLNPDAFGGDILCIGSLEPRKNQAYIMNVVAELHRRGLHVTATFLGDGELRHNLEHLARELEIDKSVHFVGGVRNAAGWLHKYKLLVHAAFLENCPLSLIEALAAGVPVVAAAVGGIPELVDDETGAVWHLDSVQDGADKVQALLQDERRYLKCKENALRRYNEHFSSKIVGKRLIETLGETQDALR